MGVEVQVVRFSMSSLPVPGAGAGIVRGILDQRLPVIAVGKDYRLLHYLIGRQSLASVNFLIVGGVDHDGVVGDYSVRTFDPRRALKIANQLEQALPKMALRWDPPSLRETDLLGTDVMGADIENAEFERLHGLAGKVAAFVREAANAGDSIGVVTFV